MTNLMRYVAIDIETTGLNPERCQVIELAAVVETDWHTPVEQLPTFHRFVNPGDEIRGEAYALWMNANILLQTKDAADLHGNLIDLGAFVREFFGERSVTIAGKNFGAFDYRFLSRNEGWRFVRHKHRFIDVGNLYWNPATDVDLPALKECQIRAGVPHREEHRAVDDCRAVIECVRAWHKKGGAA